MLTSIQLPRSALAQPRKTSDFRLFKIVITGFNTDIEHDGVVYHVQTEDKGLDSPLILSLVYSGGAILASKTISLRRFDCRGFQRRSIGRTTETAASFDLRRDKCRAPRRFEADGREGGGRDSGCNRRRLPAAVEDPRSLNSCSGADALVIEPTHGNRSQCVEIEPNAATVNRRPSADSTLEVVKEPRRTAKKRRPGGLLFRSACVRVARNRPHTAFTIRRRMSPPNEADSASRYWTKMSFRPVRRTRFACWLKRKLEKSKRRCRESGCQ